MTIRFKKTDPFQFNYEHPVKTAYKVFDQDSVYLGLVARSRTAWLAQKPDGRVWQSYGKSRNIAAAALGDWPDNTFIPVVRTEPKSVPSVPSVPPWSGEENGGDIADLPPKPAPRMIYAPPYRFTKTETATDTFDDSGVSPETVYQVYRVPGELYLGLVGYDPDFYTLRAAADALFERCGAPAEPETERPQRWGVPEFVATPRSDDAYARALEEVLYSCLELAEDQGVDQHDIDLNQETGACGVMLDVCLRMNQFFEELEDERATNEALRKGRKTRLGGALLEHKWELTRLERLKAGEHFRINRENGQRWLVTDLSTVGGIVIAVNVLSGRVEALSATADVYPLPANNELADRTYLAGYDEARSYYDPSYLDAQEEK